MRKTEKGIERSRERDSESKQKLSGRGESGKEGDEVGGGKRQGREGEPKNALNTQLVDQLGNRSDGIIVRETTTF